MSIGADLIFFVELDGTIWRVVYSVQSGTVNGSPVDEAASITTRRFLTQLHMTHGYSGNGGIRWAWALGFDAMFTSMVFWGISGLFMWWQLKGVRLAGILVLIGSFLLATLLVLDMHQSLAGL
jgi:hypothetical protein